MHPIVFVEGKRKDEKEEGVVVTGKEDKGMGTGAMRSGDRRNTEKIIATNRGAQQP